ncbi:MAG: type IV pilin protein [Burkholderiaceae bacterium]|nr:type IV pilin protein [Burkholderiaceae bacterium]
MRKKHNGFTLIELMIVVAIIGILASVAYPAYTDSVRKGRRAQARTALLELMQQQERFMTQRNCYAAFTTASNGTATATANAECGFTTATSVSMFKTSSGDSGASSASYLLKASQCGTQSLRDCISLEATLKDSAADPQVGNLTLTSTGVKSCTGSQKTTNPQLCWP